MESMATRAFAREDKDDDDETGVLNACLGVSVKIELLLLLLLCERFDGVEWRKELEEGVETLLNAEV